MARNDQRPSHARDYIAIGTKWARDVVAGRIIQGKWARLACKRHLDDLKRKGKDWPYYFDPWHGADICDFAEKMPHVEGNWCRCPHGKKGQHLERCGLIDLEPVQVFILMNIFGWRRKEDDGRRYSSVYIEMARKGAKSTLTAVVSLYCLCCEQEIGPQVIIGATTGEQAGKVFNPAKAMVDRSPDLASHFGLRTYSRSIACRDNNGFIQPINAKGKTQDGWNPHLGVLDELHAHKDRGLYDVVKSAFGARSNPLLWVITTAGTNMVGVCYEQHLFVRKILEGILQGDHYFAIIFTIDEGDDPYDPKVWPKANPMLGVTPKLKSMQDYASEAKASPASEGEFKTKRLNIWLGAANAWLNMEQWRRCENLALSWDDFDGLDCWVGGDLADKDDICALTLSAFREDDVLIFKPLFFLPEATIAAGRSKKVTGPASNYPVWLDQGWLQQTPGDWIDYDVIETQLAAWFDRYRIRHATFDQFAAAQRTASWLNEKYGDGETPVSSILTKSAPKVTDAASDLEARVKVQRIQHDGNPCMTWMASNVVVSRKIDGSILPKKETPMSENKIDGIDALVNGNTPYIVALPPPPPPSVMVF